MWNKRTDEGYGPRTPQPEPVRTPVMAPAGRTQFSPPPAAAPGMAPQTAAIGPSMRIKGEIRSQEELVVDGEVEGTLESQSLITVGTHGKVKANIKAREVVIYGWVQGNIDAAEKIAIREKGSLVGDIRTAGISIDDGAYFKGSIDIVRPEPKLTARPVKQHEPALASAAS